MGGSIETPEAAGERSFEATPWTEVLAARDAGSDRGRQALELLLTRYWKPLYHFDRRRGSPPENAKDHVQGFFTSLLARDGFSRVEPGRGKFRTWLLTSFERWLRDDGDRSLAAKRGGGAEAEREYSVDAASRAAAPERAYDRSWALEILARGIARLRAELESEGRRQRFDALTEQLALPPSGDGGIPPSYEESARRLGVTEADVRNWVHRAKRRLADLLREEVRSTCGPGEDPEAELAELLKALSRRLRETPSRGFRVGA